MPLDTYANLQASILSWLARPGDPLVSPSIPDIIQLFESEANRRLKVGGAEKRATLTTLSSAATLPADFGELRVATSGGVVLSYVTPMQLPSGGGVPTHYTIIGNELCLGPAPSGTTTIDIVYQSGVPPLSDTNTTNWLLTQHPDCYLFGSLVEAESFIGSDERVPLWAQRREAAFASIETADRKARWGGAPLSIRAEGVAGGNGAAGGATSTPAVSIPISIANGGTGSTTAPAALTALGAVAKAGDTMTGGLTLAPPSGYSVLMMNAPAGANINDIAAQHAGVDRWAVVLGDAIAESGSNAGFNCAINRYDDVGGYLGTPLTIFRATGGVNFGFPSGGDKGAGTLNAAAVYANGALLTSDASLKTDVEPLSAACLPLVAAVGPKSYRWREPDDDRAGDRPRDFSERRHSGFLAQDLADAGVPGIVEGKPGEMALDVGAMLAVLWQAVRELSAKVAALEGKPAG